MLNETRLIFEGKKFAAMDSSGKSEETQSSKPRDGAIKHKIFEKIVYFASGSIGDEVSILHKCTS